MFFKHCFHNRVHVDTVLTRKLVTLTTKSFSYGISIGTDFTTDLLAKNFLVFEVHGLQAVQNEGRFKLSLTPLSKNCVLATFRTRERLTLAYPEG